MKTLLSLRFLLGAIAAMNVAMGITVAASAESRPNIVLCMTDDQGWGDVGYNGHPVLKTPNLDSMAREGVRFDRFYAAQHNCSPTRASVLTGRHPDRCRTYAWGHDLPLGEVTIAEVAQAHGYATGHFGKWHLGGIPNSGGGDGRGVPASYETALRHPGQQGFQEWFSSGNFFDFDPPRGTLFRNGNPVPTMRGDSSEIVMMEAIKYIRAKAKGDRPFLVVIWFPSPHAPYRALAQDRGPYEGKANAEFFGEMAAVDRAMGKLRAELKSLGLRDNTLLWFNSDNGAAGGTAGNLSGGKGSLLEGGIRVPGIIEWPARVKVPFQTDMPVGTVDIFPTVCAAMGVAPPAPERLDGIDLLPLLDGKMKTRPHPLGFQASNTRTARPVDAAWIEGKWKLLRLGHSQRLGRGGTAGTVGPGDYLFDVENDPTETRDLKAKEPRIFERMAAALDQWQASVARSAAEYPFAPPSDPPALALGGKVRYPIVNDALRFPNLRERWVEGDRARFDRHWDFSEDGLRGHQAPEDKHPATCSLFLRHSDAIISVAVRLDGAQVATIQADSFSDGQVARIVVRPNEVALRVQGEPAGMKDVDVLSHAVAIKPGEWHTFLWEIRGTQTVLTMDGQVLGRAEHPNLAIPRDRFGFSVVGQGAAFRDLNIWDTTAPEH